MEQMSIEDNTTLSFEWENDEKWKKWTWKGVILIEDEKNIQRIWYHIGKNTIENALF